MVSALVNAVPDPSEAIPQNNNAMKPTENDVLSGRGAWFNQHPGNEHFRKMIDEQKVGQCRILLVFQWMDFMDAYKFMTFQMTAQ